MRKTKVIAIVLVINLICCLIFSLQTSKVFAASQRIDNQISKIDDKKYPGIKKMIENLQKQHPNWNFKVMYTGLDWATVIKEESKHGRNLIGANQKNYSGDWLCRECKNKTYSGGNWVCVSSDAIAYMMDPRNSLYYEDVFQFLELSYDSTVIYDSNIIKSILNNSFLDDGNLDNYIKTIINRSKEKNVNPYYIAGKIIQEQGTRGGSTFKMKTTEDGKTVYYYNIFNINATGSTTTAIVSNALSWAQDKGWNTIEKCLIGGVDFIANGYITIGQDTMYFEKFDVIADTYYTHQYAQDVMYAQNQGEKLRRILEGINATEYAYTFVIPLYENMPSSACVRPSTTSTNMDTNNNNSNLNTTLTTESNVLNINSKTIKVSENNIIITPEVTLKDIKKYCTVTDVSKEKMIINDDTKIPTGAILSIKNKKYTIIKLGDINGDGYVDTGDTLVAKQVILGKKKVSGVYKTAMDVNKDAYIDTGDTLILKRVILGLTKIEI